MRIVIQVLAYLWASPYTITGIATGLILGGRFQRVDGVIEIHGPRIAWLLRHMLVSAQALTLGHVVFGQDAILFLRGRDGYRDNPFEIEAYDAEERV